jgi:putative peptidoglycan lipid II flippase
MIGSAGLQVSIFADTIIGSLLPTGGFSSIYYAERIYQLPLGVIGIAAGTVLLPEMSRYLALGDRAKAFHAQNRTLAISLVLGTPFFIAFIMLPDVIMHGVFQRGAFTEIAASQSAHVLMAYGFGLIPIMLLPSVIASFRAQADTKTPMLISLIAVALNVSLKILLFSPLGAVGLATATAAGAWTNLGLLIVIALRRDCIRPDQHLAKTAACVAIAAFTLALTALFATTPILGLTIHLQHFGYEAGLISICGLGASIYAVVLIFLLRAYGIKLHFPRRKNSKGTPQSAELK